MPKTKNTKGHSESYLTRLDKLAGFLKVAEANALSAAEIARKMKCSKPTAYSLVDALVGLGHNVHEDKRREGTRGPEARVFFIKRGK